MDAHPLAVNVGEAQSAYLGDPQTGRIGGGDDGFMLHRTDGRQDAENFFRTEDDREGLGPFGMGDPLDFLGSLEVDVIEELEGVDIHAQRGRGGLPVPGQMEEEVPDLLLTHLLGRPQVMAGEMAGATEVGSLSMRAVGLEE